MPIRVACPSCGNVLVAPDAAAGKRGKCSQCGTAIHIPAASTASPPTTPPAPAPAPVVKAIPLAPPKPRGAESFDVEIEDEPPTPAAKSEPFDVEVEEESPRHPAPAPPQPPVAGDPFAFGPPPDSAAAKLKPVSFDVSDQEPDEHRPPMHPGWRSVADGLGALRRSAHIGFVVMVLAGLLAAVAGSGTGLQAVGWIGLIVIVGTTGLVGLLAVLFLVLGLVKCLKVPEPEDGGRQLALYALIATGASVICGLAGASVPLLLGAFLRSIGKALPSPTTVQAATRFLIAAGFAVVVTLLAPLVNFAIVPAVLASGGSADTVLILVILVTVFTLIVNLVALMMYLGALSTAETAIQSAVRVRGVGRPPKRTPQRAGRDRRDDEDDEDDEEPISRPSAKGNAGRDDDYNPFA